MGTGVLQPGIPTTKQPTTSGTDPHSALTGETRTHFTSSLRTHAKREKQTARKNKTNKKTTSASPPHTSTNVIFILLGGADRNMLDAMVPLKLRVYAFQAQMAEKPGAPQKNKNGAA